MRLPAAPRTEDARVDGRLREAQLTRRRQAMGLLLLAGAILVLVLLRAPAHVLFPAGWWRF